MFEERRRFDFILLYTSAFKVKDTEPALGFWMALTRSPRIKSRSRVEIRVIAQKPTFQKLGNVVPRQQKRECQHREAHGRCQVSVQAQSHDQQLAAKDELRGACQARHDELRMQKAPSHRALARDTQSTSGSL